MGNKNTTGKHAAMTRDEIIEAASVGHNAALDVAAVPAEDKALLPLLRAIALQIDAGDREGAAKDAGRLQVKQILLQCGLTETTKDQVKEMYVLHPAWPSKDGAKVGEKEARKTSPGRAWNSLCSNGYSKFAISKNGVPLITTDTDGTDCLCLNDKSGKAVKVEEVPTLSVEQEVLKAAELLRDKISPEQLDMIRGAQDIFGALVLILTGQKLAA